MKSKNLWNETVEILGENGKTWKDVEVVFCDRGKITKELYENIAKKTDYNNGYGIECIDLSLVIAGKDFKIVRAEYDGSEWFEFIAYGVNVPTQEVDGKGFKLD